jgi:ParB-like chromosome segregation protein Spo0J
MKVTHQQGDPRSLTLLEMNARFMRHETYQRLVENIREDGCLQQWPFVHYDAATGIRRVLSGNHRVQAAIDAGLDEIDWTETDEPLPPDRQTAIQLAHNAIVGEDDPATLKRLYESIENIDARLYAGLDDQTLGLLATVDTDSIAEANLDFLTLQIVFLPHEYDRAEAALKEAAHYGAADRRWLARNAQYEATLEALNAAQASYKIGNRATALDVVLDVFDRHVEDLRDGWYDDRTGEPRHDNAIPVQTILGPTLPAKLASRLRHTLEQIATRDSVTIPEALHTLLGHDEDTT